MPDSLLSCSEKAGTPQTWDLPTHMRAPPSTTLLTYLEGISGLGARPSGRRKNHSPPSVGYSDGFLTHTRV